MTHEPTDAEALLWRAAAGDCAALAELFQAHRGRLERMVLLRMDRRLQGRLDASDVIQERYLDVARRFPEYAAGLSMPFYLWLRLLTGQRLVDLHRRHLGAKMRDPGRQLSLQGGALPGLLGVAGRIAAGPADLGRPRRRPRRNPAPRPGGAQRHGPHGP
jgi:RNA polymerase sigma-70 factor (ECF subfamily)